MKLQTGDRVPDFTTTATGGLPWTLSLEVKEAPVLLVFYPGDNTAVCTKQLCEYRDNWESLKRFHVQIVGISTNQTGVHEQFSKKHNFPFPLLADANREISRKLGMLMFGLPIANRGFILVGSTMRVRYVFKEIVPIFRRKASEVCAILNAYG